MKSSEDTKRGNQNSDNIAKKADPADFQTNFGPSDDSVMSDLAAVGLKKTISLIGGVALIAGTMIGSGIFVSPKGVLADTGSVGLSLIIWAGCGVLAMLGALAYAELGSSITLSGGGWTYINTAFSPLHPIFGELPAFLLSWTSAVVLSPASVAITTLTFSKYIMSPFFDECGPPTLIIKLLTIATIMLLTAVNIYSPKAGSKVQVICFLVKLLATFAIIFGGIYRISLGDIQHLKSGFEGTVSSPSKIARAFYKGLWAYDGWNNLNFVTEELKNPRRNGPLTICLSIPLVTVVYILTNIAYFSVLSPAALLASNAVAVDWALIVLPSAVVVITVCVAFSTFGAANGSLISGSRLAYAASRGGHLVSLLSMVDMYHYSPSTSIAFTSIIAVLMVIASDIFTLIDFFGFLGWVFHGLTMASLLILRWKQPALKRPFKCPIAIPVIVLIASVYLVIAPIADSPDILYLYAALFMLFGLFLYFPLVAFKKHIKAFGVKIKKIRANTNTWIKTPARGQEPVFIISGRQEGVSKAKDEILSSADQVARLRAMRHKTPGEAEDAYSDMRNLKGDFVTLRVSVPSGSVGLVVGQKGVRIREIAEATQTSIKAPSRYREPVFEIRGHPADAAVAEEQIKAFVSEKEDDNYIRSIMSQLPIHEPGSPVRAVPHTPCQVMPDCSIPPRSHNFTRLQPFSPQAMPTLQPLSNPHMYSDLMPSYSPAVTSVQHQTVPTRSMSPLNTHALTAGAAPGYPMPQQHFHLTQPVHPVYTRVPGIDPRLMTFGGFPIPQSQSSSHDQTPMSLSPVNDYTDLPRYQHF